MMHFADVYAHLMDAVDVDIHSRGRGEFSSGRLLKESRSRVHPRRLQNSLDEGCKISRKRADLYPRPAYFSADRLLS